MKKYLIILFLIFVSNKSSAEIKGNIIEQLKDNHNLPLNLELTKNINTLIVNEYLNEYRGLN